MNWPWTRREPADDDLYDRVSKLERKVNELSLDWSDVLDKLLHRVQRQSKRDRDAAKAALETAQQPLTLAPSPSSGGSRFERLQAARQRLAARGANRGEA